MVLNRFVRNFVRVKKVLKFAAASHAKKKKKNATLDYVAKRNKYAQRTTAADVFARTHRVFGEIKGGLLEIQLVTCAKSILFLAEIPIDYKSCEKKPLEKSSTIFQKKEFNVFLGTSTKEVNRLLRPFRTPFKN